MDNATLKLYFSLFNEIGIISQLSRTLLDGKLPSGLSTAHFGILNHLTRVCDGVTPLDLARAFQVPKTTMTHTLGGLEAHELVALKANPKDGRSKCVWLTPKGRKFRETAIGNLAPELAQLFADTPPAQIEKLVADLVEIRKVLDHQRSDG